MGEWQRAGRGRRQGSVLTRTRLQQNNMSDRFRLGAGRFLVCMQWALAAKVVGSVPAPRMRINHLVGLGKSTKAGVGAGGYIAMCPYGRMARSVGMWDRFRPAADAGYGAPALHWCVTIREGKGCVLYSGNNVNLAKSRDLAWVGGQFYGAVHNSKPTRTYRNATLLSTVE